MDNTIMNLPLEDRPREKLLLRGAENLTNSELLAIVIGTGTKEVSAIMLAQKILNYEDKGLANIFDANLEFLTSFKGISNAKATKILACSEMSKRIKTINNVAKRLDTPTKVAEYVMEDMRYLKQEHFRIAKIDSKSKIVGITEISIGSLDATLVHPREVFYDAIKARCSSIILIHNHPSGEVKPSREDINLTTRLQQAGKIIGIKVVDHIIIGDGVYFSFLEHNYM